MFIFLHSNPHINVLIHNRISFQLTNLIVKRKFDRKLNILETKKNMIIFLFFKGFFILNNKLN